MLDNRQRRLMQEALDEVLSPDETQELFSVLDQDEEAAAEFRGLKRVDKLLRRAPQARAPERLAATIMARLAQRLETAVETEDLPAETREALMLSLSLVILVMMPMMVAASWLVLNALASPKLLNDVIYRTIALFIMILESLETLLDEAEHLVHDHPEAANIAISLIPLVLLGMLEYLDSNER